VPGAAQGVCAGERAGRFEAGDPCRSNGDCFFSSWCLHNTLAPNCVANSDTCAGWRNTGGCSTTASPREGHLDAGCCNIASDGASGYCECKKMDGSVYNVLPGYGCSHGQVHCQEVCDIERSQEEAYVQPCVGTWSDCPGSCDESERIWTETTPPGPGGTACPASAPQCEDGHGSCAKGFIVQSRLVLNIVSDSLVCLLAVYTSGTIMSSTELSDGTLTTCAGIAQHYRSERIRRQLPQRSRSTSPIVHHSGTNRRGCISDCSCAADTYFRDLHHPACLHQQSHNRPSSPSGTVHVWWPQFSYGRSIHRRHDPRYPRQSHSTAVLKRRRRCRPGNGRTRRRQYKWRTRYRRRPRYHHRSLLLLPPMHLLLVATKRESCGSSSGSGSNTYIHSSSGSSSSSGSGSGLRPNGC
jgi:hypothetical protein